MLPMPLCTDGSLLRAWRPDLLPSMPLCEGDALIEKAGGMAATAAGDAQGAVPWMGLLAS